MKKPFNNRFRIDENDEGYYAITDNAGNVISDYYSDIEYFNDSLAKIYDDDKEKYSLMNSNGEIVSSWFDDIEDFAWGYFKALDNDKESLFNSEGKQLCKWVDNIEHPEGDFAKAYFGDDEALVGKNGTIITDWYYSIERFKNGFAVVTNTKGEYSLINLQGKEVSPWVDDEDDLDMTSCTPITDDSISENVPDQQQSDISLPSMNPATQEHFEEENRPPQSPIQPKSVIQCDKQNEALIKSSLADREQTENAEKLESIINAIVEDGCLNESAIAVLKKAAIKAGEDPDEVCIIVKGRIAKAKKTATSSQPANVQSNKIGGPVRKCPACGADYIPGTAVCHECGYVFSGIGASSSAEKLYNILQEFNNQNKTKSDGGMMSSLLKMYNLSDDGTGDIARRKMDVIQSFPVPNNREDLFDFITSLQPKADINGPKTGVKGGGVPGTAIGKQKIEDISYAYWLLRL